MKNLFYKDSCHVFTFIFFITSGTAQKCTGCVCCKNQNDKTDKRQFYVITSLLVELNGKVDKLLNKRDVSEDHHREESFLQKVNLDFPIKTMEDFKIFDEFLKHEENHLLMVINIEY